MKTLTQKITEPLKKIKRLSNGKMKPTPNMNQDRIAEMEKELMLARKELEEAQNDSELTTADDMSEMDEEETEEVDEVSSKEIKQSNRNQDETKKLFKGWISKAWFTWLSKKTDSATIPLSLNHATSTIFQWAAQMIRQSLSESFSKVIEHDKVKRFMPQHAELVAEIRNIPPLHFSLTPEVIARLGPNIKTWIVESKNLLSQMEFVMVNKAQLPHAAMAASSDNTPDETYSFNLQISARFIEIFIQLFTAEFFSLFDAVWEGNKRGNKVVIDNTDTINICIKWLVARQHMKMPIGNCLV